MNAPLVSVIIPAYNAAAFIERTLVSVLNQSYQNLEAIVVDDGSQDETVEIVKNYAQKDERIILLQQKNAGVAAARNSAIEVAKGEFIAPIDADDIWYPQNLEKQVNCAISGGETVGLVYSWSVDIDENDQIEAGFHAAKVSGNVYKILICHNFIGNASSTLIRRQCLVEVGGYSCELKQRNAQGCEDWDLYLRLAERYHFAVVPEFLVGYRKRAGSMSRNAHTMAKSHELMLLATQQKMTKVPKILYRLSKSSFYIYLAQECHQYGDYEEALHWLFQAVKIDITVLFCRYGTYLLAFKCIIFLWLQNLFPQQPSILLQAPVKVVSQPKSKAKQLLDVQKQKTSLYLKLTVTYWLHRSLMLV
jgi:glycosyltransferase involved in cell wall biosynthesis